MNTLTKDILTFLYYPKPVLEFTPAYSYIEYRYSTTKSDSLGINSTIKYTLNPPKIRKPGTNEYITITGDKPGESITLYNLSKVNNGGSLIKVIVKVPESYSWITPTPYLKNYNVIGWNGSAISKQFFINCGEAEFSINASSIGVMVGLTTINDAVANSHYNLIRYAIYGNLGKFTVYVNGSSTGLTFRNFTTTDKFKIIIGKTGVRFLFNNEEIYFLSCTPEVLKYVLDTSLYTSYDKVLNASIKQVSYIDLGLLQKAKEYIIIDGISYEIVNGKVFINGTWYSVHTSGFVYIDGVLYLVSNGFVFINGIYVPILNGTITVDGVHSGVYVINTLPIVIIDDKIYSVIKDVLTINGLKYPKGYWVLGLGNNLISQNYSSLVNTFSLGNTLKPFYDLTSKLKLESSLIYSGGSYISGSLKLSNSLFPNYGLYNKLKLECKLNYKGYSFISGECKVGVMLYAGGLTPSIPPILTSGFVLSGKIRDYYNVDPSLYIIT